MKLEAGKRYVNGYGVIIGPLVDNGINNTAYRFAFHHDGHTFSYTHHGMFFIGRESLHDLLYEYEPSNDL